MAECQRQLVLDTETTGLLTEQGHRIIEIAAVELINRRFTDNIFHVYVNPGRQIDLEALTIHGINNEFLADKPTFPEILDDFLSYIKGAELIFHNAPFDVGFLNYEMKLCDGNKGSLNKYVQIITDTLALARKKHPGQRNSLDALCKRYNVDSSERDLHGALIDAKLLAKVYLAMTRGQISLFSLENDHVEVTTKESKPVNQGKVSEARKQLKINYATLAEMEEHKCYLKMLKEHNAGKCLWEDE
jgi:DNA polymerase III subunit epsilon